MQRRCESNEPSGSSRQGRLLLALLAALLVVMPGAAAAQDDEAAPAAQNPYIPRSGLAPDALRRYIERLEESPRTLQGRPGFAQGIVVAADRILAVDPEGELRRFALLTRFRWLHQAAVGGDDDAEARIGLLAAQHLDDSDESVRAEARFLELEHRAGEVANLDQGQLATLADELRTFFEGQAELGERHLRLASRTVAVVNRIDDDQLATQLYRQFGALFAKSAHGELAKYGRKLADDKPPADKKPLPQERDVQDERIGQVIDIKGVTADGAPFDLKQHRGKIVLVDFWATWCGPCVAGLPALKEAHQRYQKRGFEIVGVNLDEPKALAEFLAENKLPWVNLVGVPGAEGIEHPLAEQHGIEKIPTTFLIDREGKLLAIDVHGEGLEQRLAALLPAAEGDAGSGDSAPPGTGAADKQPAEAPPAR
jgi:thiol-disulfide isomerase/thioredoxin